MGGVGVNVSGLLEVDVWIVLFTVIVSTVMVGVCSGGGVTVCFNSKEEWVSVTTWGTPNVLADGKQPLIIIEITQIKIALILFCFFIFRSPLFFCFSY